MSDISNKASQQYWFEYRDPSIYRVTTFMDGVEDSWAIDGDEDIENAMELLGKAMDDIDSIDIGKEDDFATLLAYLRAPRMLRIMQALDSAHPGAASKILMYAESNGTDISNPPGLFLRRNVVFERLRLLGRVFSQQRLNMIKKALEE